MKKLLVIFVTLAVAVRANAQATNPQNTFSNAVNVSNPSLWLNFNDSTIAFKDSISQTTFGGVGTSTSGVIPSPLTASWTTGTVGIVNAVLGNGTLSTVSLQFFVAPTSGQTIDCGIFTRSGSDFTATSSFTLTVAPTTALQVFTNGTGVPAAAIAGTEYFGCIAPTGTSFGYASSSVVGSFYLNGQTGIPSGSQSYGLVSGDTLAVSATVAETSAGTPIPQQPGFDSNNSLNYSAEFPYNAWNAAPNTTLGAIEWYNPWTIMVHIDRLNWSRSGSLVLASKGDIASTTSNYWELTLGMTGLYSQLCFKRAGYGTSGQISQTWCTNSLFDAMPNGYNYNLMVQGAGTGGQSDVVLYINGSAYAVTPSENGNFGGVTIAASGGTGYASSTAFTSSGGGANCVIAGNILATSGALSGVTFTSNQGCTSTPTIVWSPAGSGGTVTVTLPGYLMNSTAYPLLVPGYVSNGTFNGISSANSSQAPTYIDEAAVWQSAITQSQLNNVYYYTDYYQIPSNVTVKPVVIFDNDAGDDADNQLSLALTIALHKKGLITLAGMAIEDSSVTSAAFWREMVDEAGLNNIPLSVPADPPNNSGTEIPTAVVQSYNSNIPLSESAWESSTTMYRTIFAKYPTTPIDIISGAGMTAIAEFMASPADSISSLTGLQMIAQDAANGGAIYAQGGGCTASSPPATTPCTGGIGGNLAQDYPSGQYVLTNNGSLPVYWIGGIPSVVGLSLQYTRTSNSPMYLLYGVSGVSRQCYDCLMPLAIASSLFNGGVQLGYSGGTGYANTTPFYLSGGGTNCQGTGFLVASGGVPTGFQYNWGAAVSTSGIGLGSGCTSTPTINLVGSTGTGGTFTAYPNLVCGTETVTLPSTDSFSSATCSNHYVNNESVNATQSPISGNMMINFVNGLIDPDPVGQPRAQ